MLIAFLMLQAAVPEGATFVFFDWGKGEISRDAATELDKVAADYAANPGPLVVVGHSDRSGPAWANRRASRERAASVADYLATKGVPRSAMVIVGKGEDAPIIDTEDGVREVQNRRVEIRRR